MNHPDISEFLPYLCQEELDEPIPNAVIELYESAKRAEIALNVRRYRNKDVFSLDANDGIENEAALVMESPQELLEREMEREQLYEAVSQLPKKQFMRIYAHYFLGLQMNKIAEVEGVNKSQITRSIDKGLARLKRILKNNP